MDRAEYLKEYRNSVRYKEAQRKRELSPARKAYKKKYFKTRAGKKVYDKAQKKYNNSESGKKERRRYHLKRFYNLTFFQRNKMLREQGGVCYICKKAETRKQHGKIQRLSVDHLHKPNKVRHLLCNRCNLLIDYLEKRPVAIKYYQRYLKEPPSGILYNHKLRKIGGITPKLRAKMLKEQGGVCYICKKDETRRSGGIVTALCADHNHIKNMIRHLLCHRCNQLVGRLEKKRAPLKEYLNYFKL